MPKSYLSNDVQPPGAVQTEHTPSIDHGTIVNKEAQPDLPEILARLDGFTLIPFDESGFEGGFEVRKDGAWIGQLYLLREDGFVVRGGYCDCGYCFSCNAAYAAYANQIRRGFRPATDYTDEKSGTRWAVMPAHFSDEQAVAASGLFGWEGGPWFADFPTVRRSPGHVLVKRREGLDV